MNTPAQEPLLLSCRAANPFQSAHANVAHPEAARPSCGSRVATELLRVALTGQARARRDLVLLLIPTIQRRVRKNLDAFASREGRPSNDRDLLELTQRVLRSLVDQDARLLRTWDSTTGVPLLDFVDGVADRQAETILRARSRDARESRQSAGEERPSEALDARPVVAARGRFGNELRTLYQSMHDKLLPQERALFERYERRAAGARDGRERRAPPTRQANQGKPGDATLGPRSLQVSD